MCRGKYPRSIAAVGFKIFYYGARRKASVPNPVNWLDDNSLKQFVKANREKCESFVIHYSQEKIDELTKTLSQFNLPLKQVQGKLVSVSNGVFITDRHDHYKRCRQLPLDELNHAFPQLTDCIMEDSLNKKTYARRDIADRLEQTFRHFGNKTISMADHFSPVSFTAPN